MLLFCPTCSNLITIARAPHSPFPEEDAVAGQYRFECRTCPYAKLIEQPVFERKRFKPKEADEIVGGAEAMKNKNRTTVKCVDERCDGTEAYHYALQIRSADEPMTNFYTCVKCKTSWRD